MDVDATTEINYSNSYETKRIVARRIQSPRTEITVASYNNVYLHSRRWFLSRVRYHKSKQKNSNIMIIRLSHPREDNRVLAVRIPLRIKHAFFSIINR